MGSAYTPGLTVSANRQIERTRRLPIKGDILVKVGDSVEPLTIVARAYLPGIMQPVKVSNILGIEPSDLEPALKIKIGDTVAVGDILAQSKGLFGWFSADAKSPIAGVVETISSVSGNVGVRQPPIPIDLLAYINGKISSVIEGEGVVVSTAGALIQGIFGFGGERTGEILVVSKGPSDVLTDSMIDPSMAGKIVVGGSNLTGAALRKADQIGVAGIVAGGLVDKDMIDFLGYDIGVAITGHEKVNTTVVITEGFGTIAMAQRTFDLLKSLDGKAASINGATQIRAGVIRPEIVVPGDSEAALVPSDNDSFALSVDTPIRIIREPYFGELATVTALPPKLTVVGSGALVRVLEAKLKDGATVTVPRANVEIVAG
jgi:hypothetical protein